jgi:hypothetical protein
MVDIDSRLVHIVWFVQDLLWWGNKESNKENTDILSNDSCTGNEEMLELDSC